jgi:hypothetical protein
MSSAGHPRPIRTDFNPAAIEQAERERALQVTRSAPSSWEWQRLLQLAVNALSTSDAAQNEADALLIGRVSKWLNTWELA